MNQLPRALQHLGRLQELFEMHKLERSLFDREITPNSLVSDLVARARVSNALLSRNPKYASLLSKIPQTQSVHHYAILQEEKEFFDRIIQTRFRDRHRYTTSNKVYFGTLERDVLNAAIMPVPESDEFLVVINQLLWDSLNLVTYIIFESVLWEDGRLVFKPNLAEIHLESYSAMLHAIEIKAPFPVPKLHHKGGESTWSWDALRHPCGSFLFGHEYSHFLHQHFTRAGHPLRIPIGNVEYEGRATDWSNEYEADRTAIDLVAMLYQGIHASRKGMGPVADLHNLDLERFMDTMRMANEGIIIALQGILVVLNLMCRIEEALNVVYTAESSHPPTWLRLVAAWGVIGQQIPAPHIWKIQEERLQPLIECVEFLANNAVLADRCELSRRAERRFQDAVFQSLFRIKHVDVIKSLKLLYEQLTMQLCDIETIRRTYGGCIEDAWLASLSYARDQGGLSRTECGAMIERAAQIVKKNAEIFGLK